MRGEARKAVQTGALQLGGGRSSARVGTAGSRRYQQEKHSEETSAFASGVGKVEDYGFRGMLRTDVQREGQARNTREGGVEEIVLVVGTELLDPQMNGDWILKRLGTRRKFFPYIARGGAISKAGVTADARPGQHGINSP